MKSIILAAGQGKRLYPLTKNIPKCMVELFGKSIIQWQIEKFRECQINDISIVRGYLSSMINFSNIAFFNNNNFSTTNMVETLFCAESKLSGTIIVSYGDIIYEKKVLQKLIECTDDLAVVVDKNWNYYWQMRFEKPLNDVESMKIDHTGFITSIGQKVQNLDDIQGQYIGLMKFQNNGIDQIKEFYKKTKNESKLGTNPLNPKLPFKQSYMTDFLQGLINANHKIKAVPIFGGWLELDSINDYQLYQKKQENNTISELISIEN